MDKVCIHCFISGRVQGVWFRGSTQKKALELGLTGWAKNLSDGRVEVMACGEASAIEALHKWLHKGPTLAKVTEVKSESAPMEVFEDFKTS